MFRQRDIVLTIFPYTDLSGSKLRPALIVSSDSVNVSSDFVCLQITSKMFDDAFFMKIDSGMLTQRMLLDSGIRLQKIFTLNQKLIDRKISEMKPESFKSVVAAVTLKVFGINF
jgi:mRNA interferase MazF